MSQPQITIDIVIIIVVIMIISEQVCVREPAPSDQAGRGHLSGLGGMHCSIFGMLILYCTVLYRDALCWDALQYTWDALYCTVCSSCISVHCTALLERHCIALKLAKHNLDSLH